MVVFGEGAAHQYLNIDESASTDSQHRRFTHPPPAFLVLSYLANTRTQFTLKYGRIKFCSLPSDGKNVSDTYFIVVHLHSLVTNIVIKCKVASKQPSHLFVHNKQKYFINRLSEPVQ